jgi:hypothetical protein
MLLTGEEGPVAVPLGPPVARTHQHASHVSVVGRSIDLLLNCCVGSSCMEQTPP